RVLQVVNLVHHHDVQVVHRVAALVEHVPEDLGGHHHHRSLAVDRVVAGQQAHPVDPVPGPEVTELLVRQRLQGGRVESLAPAGQGAFDAELGDHRLAGAGGGGHQDGLATVQSVDGGALE